jgi:hypothetical protein
MRFALLGLGVLCALTLRPAVSAEAISIAIVEFDYVDSSGEARDQSAEHRAQLKEFMASLRADLERSGRYHVVMPDCRPEPCSLQESDPAELLAASRRSGAKLLLFGGIHKMSTLVQWSKGQMIDLDTELVVFDRLLTFRGDDEPAWRRAEHFLAREILARETLLTSK